MSNEPSAIIGRIYDAALESTNWPDLLCDIADLCGVENAALVVSDPRANHSAVVTPRADPDVVAAYADLWWQHDPTAAATAHLPVGRITTLEDTGRDRFFKSAFYNEFWRFSGLGAERIATNLVVGDGTFSSCVLQASKSRDEIDDEALSWFSVVAPHLTRAVEFKYRLQRLELRNSVASIQGASGHAGTIVVDAQLRPIFADPPGEELLQSGSPIGVSGGMVRLLDQRTDATLRDAVVSCGHIGLKQPAGQRIQVRRSDCGSPVTIDVMPYRMHADSLYGSPPVAMLLVSDPDRARNASIQRLRDRFGLTRAEAALSLEIMKGDGRAAAAARCGISVNTARTHLTRIFEKTGVNRQAELIRVIMDIENAGEGESAVG